MPSENEIKDQFINETLWLYGDDLVDELEEAIRKKRLIDKNTLIDSLGFTVSGKTLRLNFVTYGRIHDLKHRKNYKRISESVDTNREIWGIKRKRQPNRRWYASTAYGMLNSLIAKLMYGFSDQEAQRMKHLLEQKETRKSDTL